MAAPSAATAVAADRSLAGRVVVVTGATGALGDAVVRACHARGARVAALGRSAVEPSPERALALGGIDLSDFAKVTRAMAKVTETLGGLDALVNVAGGFASATLADGGAEPWDRMYATNLQSAVHACSAALPALKASGRGRIVNIAAAAAAGRASAGMGAYAASKAGIIKLTEALAAELRADGVTVNALLPTILDTRANRQAMPDSDPGDWVTPDALARVVCLLLSDDAAAVSGAAIHCPGDGGRG